MGKSKGLAIWRLKGELHILQLLFACTSDSLQAVADLEVHLTVV